MKFSDLEYSTQVILKVILAGLILAFLWVVKDVIILLLLALILASAMEPLVTYFKQKKIPRAVSVLTVYVLVIGVLALVVYLLIPPIVSQFKIFSQNLPAISGALQSKLGGLVGEVNIPRFVQELASNFGSGQGVVSSTFGVFNGVFSIITVLVISFYLVAEEKGMKTFIATLLPERHHDFSFSLAEKIQKKMGLWVIGQLILSLAIFALTWVGLMVLGMKEYALVLALLAGVFEIIPYIGPFLSAVPAVFIALAGNPPLALGVTVLYVIIQKTEGYFLVPKIMEKTVGTSPLAVLIALLIGFKLAGIVGLLVAVPLVGAITVAIHEFWPGKSFEK